MTIVGVEPILMTSATLPNGDLRDVYIENGSITKVKRTGTPQSDNLRYRSIDLQGYVLLPAPVEPHAHLDKALLVNRIGNPSGDLTGAINAIRAAYPSMTREDITDRAYLAVVEAATKGYTAIRTHSDCGPTLGVRSVEALVSLRTRLLDIVDIQIVALAEPGITGAQGRANRETLVDAMAAGATLLGGCPSIDDDPRAAVGELMAIARELECDVDFHTDETTDPSMLALKYLADEVIKTGFNHRVTASHCVSLGVQDPAVAREVSIAVAAAKISIITLPQTNLYLQGRERKTNKQRGLTAIADLLNAGVCVAGGGDNWRDPFNPMGRIDPFETASLLVSAGHLSPELAYEMVSTNARELMGLPQVRIEAGSPADLLAVRAGSLAEAIASASESRIVMRAGRILSRSTVTSERDERF
ncbi:MAG: hydrolase [Actinomycetales bacterium]|nr:MAG: hydrolase [Actinomycetales bacterium]